MAALIDTAQGQFIEMNRDGFLDNMSTADATLACMNEPLPAPLAATLHRLEAYRNYLDTNDARTVAAFRASLAIEGNYELPEDIAPSGHLLAQLYDRARQDLRESPVPVDVPGRCTLYVDGSPANTKSVGRPAVLQLARPRGAMLYSGYLYPEDPQPDWRRLARRTALSRGLWVGAAGGAAASLALWGLAAGGWAEFLAAEDAIAANREPDALGDREALDGAVDRTNRLGIGAQVASGLTAGLLISAVVVSW